MNQSLLRFIVICFIYVKDQEKGGERNRKRQEKGKGMDYPSPG